MFRKFFAIIAVMGILFWGCEQHEDHEHNAAAAMKGPSVTKAVCVIHPTEGNTAHGVVTFTQTDAGIKIVAHIEGLTPGKHGFHIHQFGDCSLPNGKSAGGHFNPEGAPHAGPDAAKRHVGDMGNLVADENGVAHYERVDKHLAFSGKDSIIGRGIIIHAGEDDLTSQPTGNAGSRVGCGVIGIGKS